MRLDGERARETVAPKPRLEVALGTVGNRMSFRFVFDQFLTLFGVALTVIPVAVLSDSWAPILMVIAGVLLIGSGAWRLSNKLFPDRRLFVGLRAEVEHFMELVRRLNAAALKDENTEPLRDELRDAVDRMVMLAGKTGLGS